MPRQNNTSNDFKISQLQRTNSLVNLPIFDTRFTTVNQGGHSTTLDDTYRDINDTGNVNWLIPGSAITLYIVSDSLQDANPSGTGLRIILLIGLDNDLEEINDVIVLNGTNPVASNLQFRAINASIPLAGASPGLGSIGNITVSSENSSTPTDASIWAKYIIGDQSSQVGRYTVPNASRFVLTAILINGGKSTDMTIRIEITTLGGFPITGFEGYVSEQIWSLPNSSSVVLEAGTTIKWRGFTNSGSPASRKIDVSFTGVVSKIYNWNSITL